MEPRLYGLSLNLQTSSATADLTLFEKNRRRIISIKKCVLTKCLLSVKDRRVASKTGLHVFSYNFAVDEGTEG